MGCRSKSNRFWVFCFIYYYFYIKIILIINIGNRVTNSRVFIFLELNSIFYKNNRVKKGII